METNNRIDYLTYLFEKFTFEEINNNNLFELETFLISVLDDKDNSIFLKIKI